MVNLLDDVLFIGKAEAGKIEFNPTNINLQAFCQEILEDLTLANNQHHSFVFESHGDSDRVEMDQKLLRQMLTNLLSNAVKYSLQGGTIHLKLVCHRNKLFSILKMKELAFLMQIENVYLRYFTALVMLGLFLVQAWEWQ